MKNRFIASLRMAAILLMFSFALGLTACGSACDDLADLCDQCTNGDAQVACQKLVTNAEEDACQAAVDSEVYEAASTECSAP